MKLRVWPSLRWHVSKAISNAQSTRISAGSGRFYSTDPSDAQISTILDSHARSAEVQSRIKMLADAGGLEYPRLTRVADYRHWRSIRAEFDRLKPEDAFERTSITIYGTCSDGIGQLGVKEPDIGTTGRIQAVRELGRKLVFLQLSLVGGTIQVACKFGDISEVGVTELDFTRHLRLLRRGDSISVCSRAPLFWLGAEQR